MPQPETDQHVEEQVGEPAVVAAAPASPADEHLVDDLLVEEVSIDGMCGVY